MNILFLTLGEIKDFDQTGLYPDLINEFAEHGHNMYVVSPCEKKNIGRYELIKKKNNISLISALIPDYFGVGFIKKGIASVSISTKYIRVIKQAIPDVKFDLILYSTPPITFCSVIEKIKKRDKAVTYLLLKDIWPQGPVDIGALSVSGIKGIIYKYFLSLEKRLYSISDYIGCMSQANVDYVINHNPQINPQIVEICPNSIKVIDKSVAEDKKINIRKKYEIPVDKKVFIYGGNLGKPQGVPHIIECLKACSAQSDVFFLIVGKGTEYGVVEEYKNNSNQQNLKILNHLPKEDYDLLVGACDVGLIFLDHRFTIPNFPSRLLSYMQAKIPILACTDPNTDIGSVLVENQFGWWCESDDVYAFKALIDEITSRDLYEMGENSFNFLNEFYSVNYAYKTVMKHFGE